MASGQRSHAVAAPQASRRPPPSQSSPAAASPSGMTAPSSLDQHLGGSHRHVEWPRQAYAAGIAGERHAQPKVNVSSASPAAFVPSSPHGSICSEAGESAAQDAGAASGLFLGSRSLASSRASSRHDLQAEDRELRDVVRSLVPPFSPFLVPHSPEERLLYCHSSMRDLAHGIKRYMDQKQSVGENLVLCDDDISWGSFNDGFPNLFINNVHRMVKRDVIFLANFYPAEKIFEQLAVISMLPRYLARRVLVILPFFPTGTMERVDEEGQIPTAMTLATLLSATPLCQSGPTQLMIYDIHALQERFYFGNNVIPRLATAVPLLKDRLREEVLPNTDTLIIAFPDDGAHKRFHRMFESYSETSHVEVITCSKFRKGDKRIVKIKEGERSDLSRCHVVIVDDLVQSGSTLLSCARVMKEHGAPFVSAFVTHAVFPQQSWKKCAQAGVFHKFWYTDSCPTTAAELKGQAPFELISLAPHIAETLLREDFRR